MPPISFQQSLDLHNLPLINLALEPLAADPGGGGLVAGRTWFRTDLKQISYYDGTAVQRIPLPGSGGPPTGNAGGSLSGTYPNPGIANGAIADAQVAAGAAIAKSKLANLAIADADVAGGAAIAYAKIAPPVAGANFNGQPLNNVGAPATGTDAATKAYVDGVSQGLAAKPAAKASTAAALPAYTAAPTTLTANANGALPNQDGVALGAGDRLLVLNGAAAPDNGLYTVTQVGDGTHPWILTRDASMDANAEVPGAYVFVESGTANGASGWVVQGAGPFVLGTTAINFVQFSGAGEVVPGAGLAKAGNTLSIPAGGIAATMITDGIITGGPAGAGVKIAAGTITDANIAAGAAIAVSKVNGAVQRVTATFGDGATTSFSFAHALPAGLDVEASVWGVGAGGAQEFPDIVHTDATHVTVNYGVAPAANSKRVILLG